MHRTTSPTASQDELIDWGVELFTEAMRALDGGQQDRARILAAQAIDVLAAGCGADHPDVGNARLTLATALERCGQFAEARAEAQRAVDVMAPYAGYAVPAVESIRLAAEVALGNLDRILGNLDAARTRLERALHQSRQVFGADSDQAVTALNALGVLGKFTGQFDEAESHYREALSILQAHDRSPNLAAGIMHNLGGLCHERGEAAAGIAWAERGLAIREQLLGTEHVDVAADLGALGALYHQAGRTTQAESTYRRALTIFEQCLGAEHYEVGVVAGNLAAVEVALDRPDEARPLYERALRLKSAALGGTHPDLAVTLHNFGVLLLDTGHAADLEQAEEFFERAQALLADRLSADHPRVVALRESISHRR